MGRGSIDKPGVMLALDTGGSCNGRAFLIEPDAIDSETRILWMREMLSGAYVPHWGRFKLQDRTVPGLTFVVNKQHSRYVPQMPRAETLECLAQGEGYLGSCREYLENTISHLDEIRVKDAYLHRLQKQLQANYPAAQKK
jgi:cation transport protein ChaC